MTQRSFYLCSLPDIREAGSDGFTLSTVAGIRDIFLVYKAGQVFGYLNSCPHTGAPLDWVPGRFLDLAAELVQCATHDARFRIEDGVCVSGPCVGARLSKVPLEIRDNDVFALL